MESRWDSRIAPCADAFLGGDGAINLSAKHDDDAVNEVGGYNDSMINQHEMLVGVLKVRHPTTRFFGRKH